MPKARTKRVVRAVGLVVGIFLLAGAVIFAARHVEALPPLHTISPLDLAGIALAILFNLALTTTLFWVITRSFDATPRVKWWRMASLIGASALLNYLPMQAGSIGRAAYLKLRNGLPLRQSVVIQIIVACITVVVPVCVTLMASSVAWVSYLGVALAVVLVAITKPLAEVLLRRRTGAAWSWLPLRWLDLMSTGVRVFLSFKIVGEPVTYPQALTIAAAVMVVNLVSITPNGLGFREWAAAGVSEAIQPALGPAGVLATLVDRAVEAVVFVVVGLLATAMLRKGNGAPATAVE